MIYIVNYYPLSKQQKDNIENHVAIYILGLYLSF